MTCVLSRWRAAAISVAVSLSLAPERATAAGMDDFAWTNRPVVIFAASDDDDRALRQRALLDEARDAVSERDMVVVTVWPDRIEGLRSDTSAAALRERYGVERSRFAVLLIGKDTGVKRRSAEVIEPQELFGLIDSMPMRRREMSGD